MSRLTDLFKRARGDVLVRQLAQRTDRRIDELQAAVAAQNQSLAAQDRSLAEVRAQLNRLETKLQAGGAAAVISSTDSESWQTVAQEGELGFHKRPNMRSSASWEADVARDWQELGFEADGWAGKTIIDVGAGSRLRTLYFKDATIIALEPLADRFAAEVEWQDIDKAAEIYAVPAEKLVPELVGRADLIVSINALDHGFDFETAVQNIRQYVKPTGTVFLSFDQHDVPDKMHPLVLNDSIVRDVFERAGFAVDRSTERRRYHGAEGPCALNYWLRPVTPGE